MNLIVDIREFDHLSTGESTPLPGHPGHVVYKNDKGQLKITTVKRAASWQRIGRAGRKAAAVLSSAASETPATRNPMHERHPYSRDPFEWDDPYVQEAHDFDDFDPYGYRWGQFGATAFQPVSRKNPISSADLYRQRKAAGRTWAEHPELSSAAIYVQRKAAHAARRAAAKENARKRRKASAWNVTFGNISKLAHQIQKSRGCSFGEAWQQARSQVGGGSVAAAANPLWIDHPELSSAAIYRQRKAAHAARRAAAKNPEYSALGLGWSEPQRVGQYDHVAGVYGPGTSYPPVNRRNPGEVHYTKKGQPYVITPSGKAKFIKRSAVGNSMALVRQERAPFHAQDNPLWVEHPELSSAAIYRQRKAAHAARRTAAMNPGHMVICDRCGGTGKVASAFRGGVCFGCKGTGYVGE